MPKRPVYLFILVALAVVRLSAVEINYTSPAFEIGNTSTGSVFTSGFTFSLGSFGGFLPTSDNTSQWLTNFTSLSTTNWDETFTQFSSTATLSSNAMPFGTSTLAYVWGYNFTEITGSPEWILLTNSTWNFPTSSNLLPVSWDVSDAGTFAIVGSFAVSLGADPYLQTAAVGAIPEPSTAAAFAGFAALGLAFWRRRRAGC